MTLKEYLDATGQTQLALSREVGCSPGRMCQVAGGGRPGFGLAMRIEAATKGRVTLKDMADETLWNLE